MPFAMSKLDVFISNASKKLVTAERKLAIAARELRANAATTVKIAERLSEVAEMIEERRRRGLPQNLAEMLRAAADAASDGDKAEKPRRQAPTVTAAKVTTTKRSA